MTDLLKAKLSRRKVLQAAAIGAAGLDPALRAAVWAQGSDKPEKEEVKIGFIPLTDCASVVMASVLGIDKKYGVKIVPSKEASWAGVRDKMVNGDLDFAHVLYGLIYGVHLGTAGPKKDMAVLMTLNNNGQAITLSKKLADKGAVDAASLAKAMAGGVPIGAFAMTAAVADKMPAGGHGTTFGGNPLAIAAANAVLDVMLKPGFFDNVQKMSLLLKQKLASVVDRYPTVLAEVRGEGLLVGVKAVVPSGDLVNALREQKLLTVGAGENVVRFLAPLIVNEAEIEQSVQMLERACIALSGTALKKAAG